LHSASAGVPAPLGTENLGSITHGRQAPTALASFLLDIPRLSANIDIDINYKGTAISTRGRRPADSLVLVYEAYASGRHPALDTWARVLKRTDGDPRSEARFQPALLSAWMIAVTFGESPSLDCPSLNLTPSAPSA
jgi:hypothetical protein